MQPRTFSIAAILALAMMSVDDPLASRTGGLAASLFQERSVEEIVKALTEPGVYLDSGGAAGLSPIAGSKPEALDFEATSGPAPVWMRITGPRAAVRTGSQPTFYVYKVEGARTGKPGAYAFASEVRTAKLEGNKRLVAFATFRSDERKRSAEASPVEIVLDAQQLAEDLFRMKPAKPLPPGEYVVLPFRASAEARVQIAMNMRYAPTTMVYGFGVDPQ